MQLEDVRALVAEDLRRVDQVIVERLASDVVLVNQISQYIIGGGGKRLRPLSVLLAARACGYTGHHHVEAAAIIEFIHTATLLHDDVVDGSEMRRGRDTTIAMGEVLQLMNAHDPDTTEDSYFEVIYRKTAKLFEAGAQMAAILANAPRPVEQAMVAYGRHLGTAFQLVDDMLDYRANREELGKNLGDDLAEGKPTLPLIHALSHSPPEEAARIRAAIEEGGLDDLEAITRTIESSGGLEYTARLAQRERDLATGALADLPDSAYKQALHALADFAVSRSH